MIKSIKTILHKFMVISSCLLLLGSVGVKAEEKMELVVDHVMFPVYFNNPFVALMEEVWREQNQGKVFVGKQNASFIGVYFQTNQFYVEYLSTVKNEPFWSNALYLVVPKKYWGFYKKPALLTEYFLIPEFGSGYQLVSPDYPYLNKVIAKDVNYSGLTILISAALEKEITQIGGQQWTLPKDGSVRVQNGLVRPHEMGVINENNKLVAPLFEANPILREFL